MNVEKPRRWPGDSEEAHPEIFNRMPAQPQTPKAGQISADKARQFFDEGYLVIENFFTEEELNPCKDAINLLVDQLANKLYDAGKIKSLYSEYGYENRLTMLENEFPGANITLHKLSKLPQAFRDVWSDERLLNLVEQLLGSSDIVGHPVWNLRTKTPQNEATNTPWHQDAAYMDNGSYKVLQLTAWIPLIDAEVETGCLQVMRYGHKAGRIATHQCCAGGTWYIEVTEDEMRKTLGCNVEKNVVTCPIKLGGLLLFNNITPHQSLPNLSNKVRWSLDFRWQKAGQPVGYYGLKEGVRVRSSTDPDLRIDWEPFDAVDRHDPNAKESDEFDTTIPGPWMLKWEIVNHNRHTEALPADPTAKWGHLILG